MNTPLVDCHTHASFSDGTSTFEENVRAAAAEGSPCWPAPTT